MGILGRITDMAKAKLNGVLDEVEDPIELLDQKIRDMESSLNNAKIASAEVIGGVKQTEKKIEEARAESENWEEKVKLAMSKGEEELAKKALAKKLEADKSYTALQSTFEAQRAKADNLKKQLGHLEEELEKTRSYRNEAAARIANAEAGQAVNEILADVQTKSNSISIDSIERKISKKESLAEGLGEIAESNDLEKEFAKLNNPDLDAELEKYRVK